MNKRNYMDITEIESPWIQYLDAGQFQSFTEGLIPIRYPAKKILMMKGLDNDGVFAIQSGIVEVFTSDEEQVKTIISAGQGCIFGESSVILDSPAYISAAAVTDIEVFHISKKELKKRLSQNSELAWSLIENYARKVRLLTAQIEMLTFDRKPVERIAKLLLWMADACGVATSKGIWIKNRYTHQNVADFAGLSRVSVANVYADFYRNNILKKENGKLYITDLEKLREICGS